MPTDQRLPVAYDAVRDYIDLAEVDAYVHLGEGTDDMLRYLSRVDGGDHTYGVVLDDTTTLFVTSTYVDEAHREFPGDKIVEINEDVVTEIEQFLDVSRFDTDSGSESQSGSEIEIKMPGTTDVEHYLAVSEFADVEVIEALVVARNRKNEQEQRILANVERGAQYAMARAETVLATAEVKDDQLYWEGDPLTTDRLRAEIRKALADVGLSDGSGAIIGAGPTAAELHFTGQDTIGPNETILIDLGPRGQHGYYGDITRTFVRGEPSGWTQEAHAIVREALDAAFAVIEGGAGVPARDTYEAIVDVVESYGYEAGNPDVGLTHGTGHGVGVSIHEPPFSKGNMDLEAGTVMTIEPGLYDPERGGVRLEDLVLITEDGFENLVEYPYDLEPTVRESPPEFLPE